MPNPSIPSNERERLPALHNRYKRDRAIACSIVRLDVARRMTWDPVAGLHHYDIRFGLVSLRSPSKRSLRARIREATTTVLLESVEEVASRAGIDGATVAAIAEHAGIAVGTLYNYFPDRDSLLADLFRYRRGEIVPRLAAIARETPTGSFEQQLESYLTAVLRVFDDNRKFIKIALEVDQRRMKITGRSVMVTVRAALEDLVRPIAPATYEQQARMILGALHGVVRWRVERDEMLAPDGALIASTFAKGIRK